MKKERPQAADISSTAKQPTLDTRSLRSALGRFTTGVTVITARGPDGRLVGVTANSFNSVSLDPPLVLWSLARRSGSLSAFQGASHWAVHILTHDQSDLSAHFAKPSDDKFSGLPVSYSLEGTPLLNNCAARFLCRSAHHYDGGDHLILVGEVVQFERNDLPPLVYHDSNYAIATNVVAHGQPPVLPDTPSAGSFGYLLGSAFFYIFGQLREAAGKMGLSDQVAAERK
jgi:3-hydroxy-9,10-secoandrosta-1,3,5(10)-triene-9,17-dione monooxygenase reductase component